MAPPINPPSMPFQIWLLPNTPSARPINIPNKPQPRARPIKPPPTVWKKNSLSGRPMAPATSPSRPLKKPGLCGLDDLRVITPSVMPMNKPTHRPTRAPTSASLIYRLDENDRPSMLLTCQPIRPPMAPRTA